MSYSYSYSISTDFVGSCSDTRQLQDDITASSIATAVEGISTSGDTVVIQFSAELSAAEKTTLDNDTLGLAGGVLAAFDLGCTKAGKIKAINDYRNYKLYVVKYNWPTDSNDYDMDPTSQFKISATLGYINAGNTLPGDFKWRDANNIDRAFSDQQFKDFGRDAWDRAETMHDIAKQHKDAVDALTTISAIDAYDYTTETPTWPV